MVQCACGPNGAGLSAVSAQAKSGPVLHRLAPIQHHALQRAATLRSVCAEHLAALDGVDQDRDTAICRPAQRERASEHNVAMPDKPEDVRIEVAHELFDSSERGTLAEVGVGGQHAGIKHFLCLSPVREWADRRAAEDRSESPAIRQRAGGELWLRRRHRFLFLLLERLIERKSVLVLKVVGVGAGHRLVPSPSLRSSAAKGL